MAYEDCLCQASDAKDSVSLVAKIGRVGDSGSSPGIGKMGLICSSPTLFNSLPCMANRESIPNRIDLDMSFSLTT
jgi:hypothetical protein